MLATSDSACGGVGVTAAASRASSLLRMAENIENDSHVPLGSISLVPGSEAAAIEEAEAAANNDLMENQGPSIPEPSVRIDYAAHVGATQTDAACAEARVQLRVGLAGQPLYERWAQEIDEGMLRRFLTARGNDVAAARKLLLEALDWREQRLPRAPDFEELEAEAVTGKMRVAGLDVHGRAVVVFDPAAQNTRNSAAHLRFLAFNLEHAVRRMQGTAVEKYIIFMHLEGFSVSSCPPRAFLKDACAMLTRCFPERCGNIIFHHAPRVFSGIYKVCSSVIDPRTAAKFVFIVGDDSPGSVNDATLRELIGARWRILTGIGQPRQNPASSPGYNHSRDWGAMLAYERAWRCQSKIEHEASDVNARLDEKDSIHGYRRHSSDGSTDLQESSKASFSEFAASESSIEMGLTAGVVDAGGTSPAVHVGTEIAVHGSDDIGGDDALPFPNGGRVSGRVLEDSSTGLVQELPAQVKLCREFPAHGLDSPEGLDCCRPRSGTLLPNHADNLALESMLVAAKAAASAAQAAAEAAAVAATAAAQAAERIAIHLAEASSQDAPELQRPVGQSGRWAKEHCSRQFSQGQPQVNMLWRLLSSLRAGSTVAVAAGLPALLTLLAVSRSGANRIRDSSPTPPALATELLLGLACMAGWVAGWVTGWVSGAEANLAMEH
mmetsp:Transcript_81570/g.205246  ORF Transcript_81570/g.205246 Transcript_81570/m.205246 type:complete len:665 (+) Transcript_81570:56-2050(+)